MFRRRTCPACEKRNTEEWERIKKEDEETLLKRKAENKLNQERIEKEAAELNRQQPDWTCPKMWKVCIGKDCALWVISHPIYTSLAFPFYESSASRPGCREFGKYI